MHPAKMLAGWFAALWIVLLVIQPERTTTFTADTLGTVLTGIASGLEDVLPDEPLPTAAETP